MSALWPESIAASSAATAAFICSSGAGGEPDAASAFRRSERAAKVEAYSAEARGVGRAVAPHRYLAQAYVRPRERSGERERRVERGAELALRLVEPALL